MYLPIVQLSAEADWNLRRHVTDAARTRDAALRRARSVRRAPLSAGPRRRFPWLPIAPRLAPSVSQDRLEEIPAAG